MPGQCKAKKEDSNETQMLQNFTDSYLVCTCLSKLCYCPSIYIPMFCKISLGGKLQNNICCELSNRSFCTFLPWSPATKLCSLFDLLTIFPNID